MKVWEAPTARCSAWRTVLRRASTLASVVVVAVLGALVSLAAPAAARTATTGTSDTFSFPPVVNALIALGILGGMLALVLLRRRYRRNRLERHDDTGSVNTRVPTSTR